MMSRKKEIFTHTKKKKKCTPNFFTSFSSPSLLSIHKPFIKRTRYTRSKFYNTWNSRNYFSLFAIEYNMYVLTISYYKRIHCIRVPTIYRHYAFAVYAYTFDVIIYTERGSEKKKVKRIETATSLRFALDHLHTIRRLRGIDFSRDTFQHLFLLNFRFFFFIPSFLTHARSST